MSGVEVPEGTRSLEWHRNHHLQVRALDERRITDLPKAEGE